MNTKPVHNSEFITHHSAFTLMEVMIAIGILGVGAVMAASLFPAAVKESNTSYKKSFGGLICQNGYAAVKARLADDPSFITSTFGTLNMGTLGQYFPTPVSESLDEHEFVSGEPIATQGFIAYGKKVSGVCTITIVAFQRNVNSDTGDYDNVVESTTVSYSNPDVENDVTTFRTSNSTPLYPGSAIITNVGRFAYVEAVNPIDGSTNKIILDRELTLTSPLYTIAEKTSSSGGYVEDSPALLVQTFRTGI
jgi:prepilin-type N-terminal cleavage/methylation domain-containing protein